MRSRLLLQRVAKTGSHSTAHAVLRVSSARECRQRCLVLTHPLRTFVQPCWYRLCHLPQSGKKRTATTWLRVLSQLNISQRFSVPYCLSLSVYIYRLALLSSNLSNSGMCCQTLFFASVVEMQNYFRFGYKISVAFCGVAWTQTVGADDFELISHCFSKQWKILWIVTVQNLS